MQVSFSVNVHFPLGDWWLGSIAFKRLRTALLYSPCQKKWGIKTFELNKYLSSLNVKSWINVLVLYLPFQFWFSRPWRRKVPWSGKKKKSYTLTLHDPSIQRSFIYTLCICGFHFLTTYHTNLPPPRRQLILEGTIKISNLQM